MVRQNDRKRFKYEAERKFPFRVDIVVPPTGLGQRINEMHEWCMADNAPGTWAQHNWRDLQIGREPIDYARYYFATEAAAERFRAAWLPGGTILKIAI